MASGQMYLAVALRGRLPRVAALFAEGSISARLAAAIVWHTDLIKDPQIVAIVDAALACDAAKYGPLSVAKAAQAIDAVVDRHDPAALRRAQASARRRDMVIRPPTMSPAPRPSGAGCSPPMRRSSTDGSCRWHTRCATTTRDCGAAPCRRPGCAGRRCRTARPCAAKRRMPCVPSPTTRRLCVVIHGSRKRRASTANPTRTCRVNSQPRPITPDTTAARGPRSRPGTARARTSFRRAMSSAAASVPATRFAELVRRGARSGRASSGRGHTRAGYRPSTALESFVRCRDLTCRFPNCDQSRAALRSSTIRFPYPARGRHTLEPEVLCRKHHLLKTFWAVGAISSCPTARSSGTPQPAAPISRGRVVACSFRRCAVPTGELPNAPTDGRTKRRAIAA